MTCATSPVFQWSTLPSLPIVVYPSTPVDTILCPTLALLPLPYPGLPWQTNSVAAGEQKTSPNPAGTVDPHVSSPSGPPWHEVSPEGHRSEVTLFSSLFGPVREEFFLPLPPLPHAHGLVDAAVAPWFTFVM